jgi:hypothetical protein
MKKIVFACCCLVLAALIVSGFWVSGIASPFPVAQDATTTPTSQGDILLQRMTQESDLIVTGSCLETRSTWIEDGRVLVTIATISVNEVIKGDQAATVDVVLPGGVDLTRRIPVAMTYAGAPQITAQEEVVLFLVGEQAVPNSYAVAEFASGKLSIVQDEGGEKLVSPDPIKPAVNDGPGRVRGSRQFIPLTDFKEKIRGFLGR